MNPGVVVKLPTWLGSLFLLLLSLSITPHCLCLRNEAMPIAVYIFLVFSLSLSCLFQILVRHSFRTLDDC